MWAAGFAEQSSSQSTLLVAPTTVMDSDIFYRRDTALTDRYASMAALHRWPLHCNDKAYVRFRPPNEPGSPDTVRVLRVRPSRSKLLWSHSVSNNNELDRDPKSSSAGHARVERSNGLRGARIHSEAYPKLHWLSAVGDKKQRHPSHITHTSPSGHGSTTMAPNVLELEPWHFALCRTLAYTPVLSPTEIPVVRLL